MSDVQERLRMLGIELPVPPKPVAAYVPAVQYGDLVQTAGQLPLVDGALAASGRVGQDLDVATGAAAARISALNALSVAAEEAGGLHQLASVIKLSVFVACDDSFNQHALVANGASEVLGEIFGDAGRHARSAVGVSSLPLGAPVEVEALFSVHRAV